MKITHKDLKYIRKRHENVTIGVCFGGFDLFHAGHLNFVRVAKENCDILVVGVRDDQTLKIEKGSSRPIYDEKSRLEIIDALKYTDYSLITTPDSDLSDFEKYDTSEKINWEEYANIFRDLKPDRYLLVNTHTLPDSFMEMLKDINIEIVIINYTENISSTQTIEKINKKIDL